MANFRPPTRREAIVFLIGAAIGTATHAGMLATLQKPQPQAVAPGASEYEQVVREVAKQVDLPAKSDTKTVVRPATIPQLSRKKGQFPVQENRAIRETES